MSVFDFFRKKTKIRDTFYYLPLKDGGCGPKLYVSHRLRHLFSTPAQGVSPAPVFVLKSTSMSQGKFVLAVFDWLFAYLFQAPPPRREIFVSNLETGISPSATFEDENVYGTGAIRSRLLLTKILMSFII